MRIGKFIITGLVGLGVDTLLTITLIEQLDFHAIFAKAVGFIVAVIATFIMNLRYTFQDLNSEKSFSAKVFVYFFGQSGGAVINIAIFGLVIYLLGKGLATLLIACLVASATAAVFNYIFARKVVFS